MRRVAGNHISHCDSMADGCDFAQRCVAPMALSARRGLDDDELHDPAEPACSPCLAQVE